MAKDTTKKSQLGKRILFTLAMIVVFRLGSYIPVPGVDPLVMQDVFSQQAGGIFGIFDVVTGGALGRMTIFALNIMPYISASIIMQILTFAFASLAELRKEGEIGRAKLNQYTRYLTILVAVLQSYAIAVGIENLQTSAGLSAVLEPGLLFRITTTVTLTAGVFFVLWIGEQITERGIGNGISLVIFSGIVAGLPNAIGFTLELGRTGGLSFLAIISLIVLIVVVVFGIVFMERAQRRIIIQYPRQQMMGKTLGGENSYLPLKINSAGVIPAIFASSLLLLPVTIVGFLSGNGPDWLLTLSSYLGRGQLLYMLFYAALIVFFAFFYAGIVFDSKETANTLKRNGGFIPGIRPGEHTAEYLNYLLNRITVIGSAYLVVVCLLPEFLIQEFAVPFYFGGTSLLIVVSVTLDTVAQVQAHVMAQQYESLMKKSKLGIRRK